MVLKVAMDCFLMAAMVIMVIPIGATILTRTTAYLSLPTAVRHIHAYHDLSC